MSQPNFSSEPPSPTPEPFRPNYSSTSSLNFPGTAPATPSSGLLPPSNIPRNSSRGRLINPAVPFVQEGTARGDRSTVFSLVLDSILAVVKENIGDDAVQEILTSVTGGPQPLQDLSFLPPSQAKGIAEAAARVVDLTQPELMRAAGKQCINVLSEGPLKNLVRSVTSLEYMCINWDTIAKEIFSSLPHYPASTVAIWISGYTATDFNVHYRSSTPDPGEFFSLGFSEFLCGVIETIASLFEINVDIDFIPRPPGTSTDLFVVHISALATARPSSAHNDNVVVPYFKLSLPPSIVQSLFPYHIVFSKNLEVQQMGYTLQRLLPKVACNRSTLASEILVVSYPYDWSWDFNQMKALATLNSPEQIHIQIRVEGASANLMLRGRLMYESSKNVVMAVLTPQLKDKMEAYLMGITREDFPPESLARAMVVSRVPIHRMASKMDTHKIKQLERSDRLLLNTLPRSILTRLKRGEKMMADFFPECTVGFCDIVNFQKAAKFLTPLAVVHLLAKVVAEFDICCGQFEVEKIKTIGDNYMVASGLPMKTEGHALNVVELAIQLQRSLLRLNSTINLPDGVKLDVRCGINTGPVVAGVIGTKKVAYDLWGDAVNTASRMQSTGIPGYIQVSYSSYSYLKDIFLFDRRGPIAVKGKGDMQPYVLIGRYIIDDETGQRYSDRNGRFLWTRIGSHLRNWWEYLEDISNRNDKDDNVTPPAILRAKQLESTQRLSAPRKGTKTEVAIKPDSPEPFRFGKTKTRQNATGFCLGEQEVSRASSRRKSLEQRTSVFDEDRLRQSHSRLERAEEIETKPKKKPEVPAHTRLYVAPPNIKPKKKAVSGAEYRTQLRDRLNDLVLASSPGVPADFKASHRPLVAKSTRAPSAASNSRPNSATKSFRPASATRKKVPPPSSAPLSRPKPVRAKSRAVEPSNDPVDMDDL